jgi:hypothetical protein
MRPGDRTELIAEGHSTLPIAPFPISRFATQGQDQGLKEA